MINERLNAIKAIISDSKLQFNLEKILKQSEGIDEIIQFFHQYTLTSSKREYSSVNLKCSERKFKIMFRIRNSLDAFDILNKEINLYNQLQFLNKSYKVK